MHPPPYDPWHDVDHRHPDVHVADADIAPATAAWIREHRVVLLDHHLDSAGRRCGLAHELVHVDLDDRPTRLAHFDRRAELRADRIAAGRLIRYQEVVAALAVASTVSELAAELEVTPRALATWAQHLHPARREHLARHVDRREVAA